MLSHFIYFFRHLLYLRVIRVLFIEPSSILFGILFIRFSRISTVPLTPPVSITIAAPLSLIFSPRTIISSRLSPLFLTVFRFYLFSSLPPFSVTDTLSLFFRHISVALSLSFILFHSHLLDVHHFNYCFNLCFFFI